ncbi:hypothetical protein ACFY36_03880 [Actinoplanes sp. NPDC000266]
MSLELENLYKALIKAYPREALQLLCGIHIDDQTTVEELEAPWQADLDEMRALLWARYGDFEGNVARIVAGATLAELRS